MTLSPDTLARIREALSLMAEETDGDDRARQDTLEMLTDAIDIADAILARNAETRAFKDVLAAQIAELRERQTRYVRRDEREREALRLVMEAGGLRKMERPAATLTLAHGPETVLLAADFECPSQMLKIVPPPAPEPDTKAILAHLRAGEHIPGAALGRAPDRLTIRRT